MENQRLQTRLSSSIYMISRSTKKMNGRPYFQQPNVRTKTKIVCPLDCPCLRQITDTTPLTKGFYHARKASQMLRLKQSGLKKSNPILKNSQRSARVNDTPPRFMGNRVLVKSKNILTKQLSRKLDHGRLGSFSVCQQISMSTYKLTLPLSMKGGKPVFHVYVLCKYEPD